MKLSRYLTAKDITSKEFAKKMRVSLSSVNKWRIKNRTPKASVIAKIHKATRGKVTLRDWH